MLANFMSTLLSISICIYLIQIQIYMTKNMCGFNDFLK